MNTRRDARIWLALGLCLALFFPMGAGVAEAKKKSRCEGTKKQRKQNIKLLKNVAL